MGNDFESFECDACPRYFGSERARFQHMEALNHFEWECSDHNYCRECQKTFANFNNLKMHLNSRTHRGQQIQCPFCNFVRSKDPDGAITKNLIGWYGSMQVLHSLNQHLNSPAHQENLYHCRHRSCGKEFTTLAGIINHIESESCGCTRFENVQRSIRSMVSGNKLIAF
ncbi:zinc finger X-chromosomal protein [Diplogelasinospora grovesii]|uniref:Zinc finger X-chromosomal protein n=1 Tax=Diplogelasinospora grovesii TaxID=303347 RepID=A0AAN6N818_9PEZI|nr:zinc finger X-chromosomal protein [Diplogelasinospora grovesii]